MKTRLTRTGNSRSACNLWSNKTMTLRDFLGTLDVSEVISAIDNSQVLCAKSASSTRTDFGWETVDFILRSFMNNPEKLRLFRDGKPIPSIMLMEERETVGSWSTVMRRLTRSGVSFVADSIADKLPDLQELAHDAERRLRCRLTVGTIATYGRGCALRPHYDNTDILVLQISGQKKWMILGDSPVDGPGNIAKDEQPPQTVSQEFVLAPGDLLVLPRGHWHRCWSDESTLQLSLLLQRNTGVDLLAMLARRAFKLAPFRRPLPISLTGNRIAAFEAGWKQEVHVLLDQLALEDLICAEDGEALPILDTAPSADPSDSATVVSLTARRPVPVPHSSESPLQVGNVSLGQTKALKAVLEVVNDAISVTVDELAHKLKPAFTAEEITNSLRRLEGAGWISLKQVTPSAARAKIKSPAASD